MQKSMMTTFWEILTFRRMVAPIILQVLFWAGIAGTIYGSYVLVRLDHWAWWMPLIFGTLVTRVIFEGAILLFRTYDRLGEIRELLRMSETRTGR
jgi:hypothetical protein